MSLARVGLFAGDDVAAEGALGAIGYDYAGLMKRLLEQPGDDNESLVKGIIGDYSAAISRGERAGQAVFANRADEYGNAMGQSYKSRAIVPHCEET